MLNNEKILCLSGIGWRFVWQRMQQLMSLFARHGNRVLFVEPFISPLTWFKYPEIGIHAGLRSRLILVEENLSVLTPPFMLPFSSCSRFIMKANHQFLNRIVNSWQKKLGFGDAILWVYNPYGGYYQLKGKLVVYDCADDYASFLGVDQEQLREVEAHLVKAADVVFVTAQALLDDRIQLNPNTFLIPNGVDFKRFALVGLGPIPDELKTLPRPILGFVGLIKNWVDLDLLELLARMRPDWSVVMVGPVAADVDTRRFHGLKNVHFLGQKDRDVLPHYVLGFDVCLNPLRNTPRTASINPSKVYQYLAAGKPVVSSDIPEVRALGDVVRLASSPEGFVEQIERALQEDDPNLVQARLEVARRHDWGVLVEAMSQKIQEVLASR